MAKKILKSQNKGYGFWGTTELNYPNKETQDRWNDAFEILVQLSGKSQESIREYLDSPSGRHLADECYGKNVKATILSNYYKYYEKDLFGDRTKIIKQKDKTMFGTLVLNRITGSKDVVLYTYKNPNRINKDYATCIDINEQIYDIGLDFIVPIEE